MTALQYLYTSWKNGDSLEKGYMIYSKSSGITDEECDEIKFVMQYEPPGEMTPNPSEEQILDEFPYSFACFELSTGRVCVAQSTYLGKDYSGRFGNYLIHALVMDRDELQDFPAEFFGEDFIKTSMTEEELNAESPVPPLPPLDIDAVGSVINDGEIMEFLGGREDQLKYLLSAILLAGKKQIPVFLNDTRENLVMWCAAIQKMFSLPVAKRFTFNTYVFNQEKFSREENKGISLMVIGVRPDANYFHYATETNSERHMVVDFLGGSFTQDVPILKVADGLADSYSAGMDRIYEFGNFLNDIGYDAFDFGLEYAYQCFCVQKGEPFSYTSHELRDILAFAREKIPESMNTDIATALMESIEPWLDTITLEDMETLIIYLYRYADFMAYTVHGMLLDFVYHLNEEGEPAERIFELLENVKNQTPEQFQNLLIYFSSQEMQGEHDAYLEGNPNQGISCFYGSFLMRYFAEGTDKLPDSVEKLFNIAVHNILNAQDCERGVQSILSGCEPDARKEQYVLASFEKNCAGEKQNCIAVAATDFLRERDSKNVQDLLNALMDDPSTIALCCQILAVLIREADDGQEVFWDFYRKQKNRLAEVPDADLDSLIDAYLDKDKTAEAAVNVLEQIPVSYIHGRGTVLKIVTRIEHLPLDKLRSQSFETLNGARSLAACVGLQNGTALIEAVLFERHCEEEKDSGRSLTDLSDGYCFHLGDLKDLDKKTYELYLKYSMDFYVFSVQNTEDLKRLFEYMFCKKYADVFTEEYMRALKHLMKDGQRKWMNCLVITNEFLIQEKSDMGKLKEFCGQYYRYLQKMEEEDYNNMYKRTMSRVGLTEGKAYFDRVSEKLMLKDKINGFLKKNS